MTCMEDSKWVAGIAARAVAVYIFGMNKPILVKWRWNTLTQRFLQVVGNTKKALYLGVKLQVRQQKKRKLRRRTRRTEEKRPCAPFTLRFARCRSRGLVASGMQAGRLVRSMGSTSRLKGEEHGRRKKAFHWSAWWLKGAERRIQKVECSKNKVLMLLVKGKIHCHYH